MTRPEVVSARTELLTLPKGSEVKVVHRRVEFSAWPGAHPESDWNGKKVVGPPDRPFAELAMLSEYESSGWDGAWVYRPGRFLATWEPRAFADVPLPVRDLHGRLAACSGHPRGCWDLMAWRGGEVMFAECKWLDSSDRIRESQLTWLQAGLDQGLSNSSFEVIEWTVTETDTDTEITVAG